MRLFRRLSCLSVALVGYGVPTCARASATAATLDVPTLASPLPLGVEATPWPSSLPNVSLAWDVVHGRPATEKTVASVGSDGRFLYVRFVAEQREPVTAVQRTNDVGSGSDDEVWVDLWPNGSSGFSYQFIANPVGTHYATSSENTIYQPTWASRGRPHGGGYSVDMQIPLAAIRGAHAGLWRAQFVRLVHATGEEQVWTYGQAQTNADAISYAGSIIMPAVAAGSRPQPRLALYALGSIAASSAGGPTSRSGADLSVPITPTASFYATIHPDFSNVELDQQSIAPTAYQRYYSEVRPFFTQGAGFYNQLNCDVCTNITELYTPAIPTPRRGYAVEGNQGRIGFASFDSAGDGRNDVASVLNYRTPDHVWEATIQRVAVTTPTLLDDTTTSGLSYYDQKHISAYFDYGNDHGSNVALPDDAQRYDVGGGWGSQTFALFGSMRKVGDDYQPADGYVQHPGIAGYAVYSNKIWLLHGASRLQSISLGGVLDRYHGRSAGLNQSDNELLLDVLTKSAIDVALTSGSSYLRTSDGIFTPVSQNGINVLFGSGSNQNSGNFGQHGSSSAYPTTVSYDTGRYGNGRLDTWVRSRTFAAGKRGSLTLELDDTAQWFSHGTDNVQWFERIGYAYQLTGDSSLALGVRRIVGSPPLPNGGGNCIGVCSNVSFAYHRKTQRNELYLGYGDPNTLVTRPQLIFKFIYYVGAEKGT
ncbi:MAG: hypothetical protein GIX03_11140 [Candidatus Eremiobacteraeota bacterium]|nr:hypothetical protein [Candidatus Eremiobacteraeota bacterium]MBC5803524.1 hypothetical protein [Candidatus Eremiobacteraeota bacterium]MBC5822126.1 hypothetical protein [Candidatus Eremiobacteraeota bacterium]